MKNVSGPSFSCPDCGIMYSLSAFFPQAYYLEVKTKCSHCNKSFDFWKLALDQLKQRSALFRNWAAAFIGAQHAYFEIELAPGQICAFKFSDYDIPEGAKILYLNYTSIGTGMFPVELHSNEIIPRKTFPTVTLFGRPTIPTEEEQTKTKVGVFATFLTHSPDEHALSSLASAFDAFLEEDYESMIIPASVAVENTMFRLSNDFLKESGLPIDHKPSKQLAREILLPLACRLKAVPAQRTHIIALVKNLWSYRDKMAHSGHLEKPLGPAKAAELICAAIFEINYFRFIRPRLVGTT